MKKLIRFYATWRGPCRMSEPAWNEFVQKYKDKFEFKDVNIDMDVLDAVAYGINAVPAIVLSEEEDGKIHEKVRFGSFNLPILEEFAQVAERNTH